MKFRGRRKKHNNIYFIIFIIIVYCTFLLEYIENKADDMLVRSVQLLVNKDVYKIIYDGINNVFINEDVDDMVEIVSNESGEVLSIDYKFNDCYRLLNKYKDYIYDSLTTTDFSDKYYEDGVYFVSSSLINNAMLFNNLGLKIPMKVNVATDLRINFKTKVKSYGINSILVELYLIINVHSWFVNPFNDGKFGETQEYVISSKIINGKIPDYFGGVLEKSSAIVSS